MQRHRRAPTAAAGRPRRNDRRSISSRSMPATTSPSPRGRWWRPRCAGGAGRWRRGGRCCLAAAAARAGARLSRLVVILDGKPLQVNNPARCHADAAGGHAHHWCGAGGPGPAGQRGRHLQQPQRRRCRVSAITVSGPTKVTGRGQHAQPRASVRLPARHRRAKRAACAAKHLRAAGNARLPPPGDEHPMPAILDPVMAAYQRRPPPAATSTWASSTAWHACWWIRASCSAWKRIRPRRSRVAPIRSATSSWPRACRSSCGAACPTTSCCSVAAAGRLSQPAELQQAGDAHAGRSAGPARCRENFAAQWLILRSLATGNAG